MKHKALIFFSAFILFQARAEADHLPESLLASGEPETALAGIELGKMKLTAVVHLYGEPTRRRTAPNNLTWTGYIWEFPGGKIELDTDKGTDGPQLSAVYVEGTVNGNTFATGRGLKIGDGVEDLKRIYGTKFEDQATDPSEKRQEFAGIGGVSRRITLQWRKEDFTLTAGLNRAGKIVSLSLMLPECYPDPCE